MKIHVGTDRQGLVHALTTTNAAQPDVGQLPYLLHGEERVLYGDRAYWKKEDGQLRARGEHAFHVVKTLWGFTKVRYRPNRTSSGRRWPARPEETAHRHKSASMSRSSLSVNC